jgi:hypothetical protein
MGVMPFTKPGTEARIIQNAVAVALEARSLCYDDASPELEAALKNRAHEIWKRNQSIRTVPWQQSCLRG